MSDRTVGVVIPAYDAWPSVRNAVDSVLAQDVPTELVVVDDGSADPLEPLLAESHPGVTVLRQPNRGQGSARNRGMAAIDTEFVGFLDADDVWRPSFLSTQLGTLTRFTGASGVLASSNRSAVPTDVERAGQPRIRALAFEALVHTLRGTPGCSAWLFRRRALTELGGFDERFRRMQDRELLIRLTALGHTVLRDHTILYDYRPSKERGGLYLTADLDALQLFAEKYGVGGPVWAHDRLGSAAQARISGMMLSRASNVALANGLGGRGRELAERARRYSTHLDRGRRLRLTANRRIPGVIAFAMRLMAHRWRRYPARGDSQ